MSPRHDPDEGQSRWGKLCTGCGICCEMYGHNLYATKEDIARWRQKAPWLLEYVLALDELNDLWRNPITGDEMERCPWVGQAGGKRICRIHHLKPDICRGYPYSVEQMRDDACEILPLLRPEEIDEHSE